MSDTQIRQQLVNYYRRLAHMLGSGVPVLQATDVASKAIAQPDLQEAVAGVREGIRSGLSMAAAAEQFPQFFSDEVRAVLAVGENRGKLDQQLLRVAEGLEQELLPVGSELGRRISPHGLADAQVVVEMVNQIVAEAAQAKASDIHFDALSPDEGLVRFRIDGMLSEHKRLDMNTYRNVIARWKIMAAMDTSEWRRPQDGRIRTQVDQAEVDLRVSSAPSLHGEALVVRLLHREAISFDLDELYPAPEAEKVRRWMHAPTGIIVITGPAGCGKTTCAYAMLSEINSARNMVASVEDPVEYDIPGVRQIQIHPQSGLTYARAFRSLLRQDPDVVFVGETRDTEVANLCVQMALTGHLVLTQLHTQDACSTIARLIDMDVPPFLIRGCVNAVQAQRLVRCLCPDCRQPPSPDEPTDRIRLLEREPIEVRSHRSVGCEKCHGTGYRGRIAIYELLEMSDPLGKHLAGANLDADAFRREARKAGVDSMIEFGLRRVNEGVTTLSEVARVMAGSPDWQS